MPRVLATDLTREHALELAQLEAKELKRLRVIYEQGRREVLARLTELGHETFSAQHYRMASAQIEAGLAVMTRELRKNARSSTQANLETGVEQTLAEIALWERRRRFKGGAFGRIQLSALRRIATPRALLVHQYDASIAAYGQGLIGEMQRRLGVHLVKRSGWREMALDIAGRLDTNGIQGARWKAERIVRTEMVNALNGGHQAALQATESTVPGLKQQWDATLDERTSNICRTLNGQVQPLDQPFTLNGREIQHPPAHSNCRSRVIPWHEEWEDQVATEEEDARKARGGAAPREEKPPITRRTARERDAKRESLLRDFEDEIRDKRVEHAILVDRDGQLIFRKTDNHPRQVSFDDAQASQMAGAYLTHNHPSGVSFSIQDVVLAMNRGLREMRVTGSRGYDYVMRLAPRKRWSIERFEEDVAPVGRRIEQEVHAELQAKISAGILTAEQASFQHFHLLWKRVSREVGLDYSRRRSRR